MNVHHLIASEFRLTPREAEKRLGNLEAMGVHVIYAPVRDICPNCGYHGSVLEDTGWCVKCTYERELEAIREADAAEEELLREGGDRAWNELKKQRQRMREEHHANPRKRSGTASGELAAPTQETLDLCLHLTEEVTPA